MESLPVPSPPNPAPSEDEQSQEQEGVPPIELEHEPATGAIRYAQKSDPFSPTGTKPAPSDSVSAATSVTNPPRRSHKLAAWLLFLLCLLIATPPLLIELQQPDVGSDEAQQLLTSMHTWRQHRRMAENGADTIGIERIVPYVNDAEQLRHPPATTWSHLVAILQHGDEVPDVSAFVWCGRLATVVFALLMVAAVFWAGHSLGGITTAGVSALICAASPLFIWHGRVATSSSQEVALTVLTIAAALWAIRPLRPAPSVERQFIGWVTCGLALGAAILTGGPWILFYVVLTILILLVLCPGRVSHLLGLLAAVLIGTLMVIPWAVYAEEHDPSALPYWKEILLGSDRFNLASLIALSRQRMWMVLAAMFPVTLWVVGAILQPFSTSSAGSRIRMLLGWVWFIITGIGFVLGPPPSSDGQALASGPLLIVPVGSLLVGQLFTQYADLAAQGRYARLWRILRWPHLALLIFVSAAIPALMYLQGPLQSLEWISTPFVAKTPLYYGPVLAVASLAFVFLGLRWAVKQFPVRAMVCWSLWMIVLATVVLVPVARGPALNQVDEAKIISLIEENTVYWLGSSKDQPNPILLLYASSAVPVVTKAQLEHLEAKHDSFLLATEATDDPPAPSFHEVESLRQLNMTFWQYSATAKLQALGSGEPTQSPDISSSTSSSP